MGIQNGWLACPGWLMFSPQVLDLSICYCRAQSNFQLSASSPLCLWPAAPVGGFEQWDWRALAFPYSEKTICSYAVIICHNSYLTAFIWFTPRVMMHVIRTRHHRLVLHCKCNHFFEGKHLSSHQSSQWHTVLFTLLQRLYPSLLCDPPLHLSVPSVSYQFHTVY